jgi:hypothetical protein
MFNVGDIVKVKEGVKDPDFEELEMSGWQGKIVEIFETNEGRTVHIIWDNTTMNQMPDESLQMFEDEGFVSNAMTLSENDVESAEARPEEDLVERDIDPYLDEDFKKIAEILGEKNLDVDAAKLKKYLKYLKENIELPGLITGREDFPWEERYVFGYGNKEEYEELKKTRPSYRDTFHLFDITYEGNEADGLIAKIKRIKDGKIFEMTLDYLESKDKKSINKELLDAYAVWYVNYR